jgi:hypothetical protein
MGSDTREAPGKGASLFFCSDFFLYTRLFRVIIYLEKEMPINVS